MPDITESLGTRLLCATTFATTLISKQPRAIRELVSTLLFLNATTWLSRGNKYFSFFFFFFFFIMENKITKTILHFWSLQLSIIQET